MAEITIVKIEKIMCLIVICIFAVNFPDTAFKKRRGVETVLISYLFRGITNNPSSK